MVEEFDLSCRKSPWSLKNKILRSVWNVIWLCFFRPSPRILFKWRNLLLILFGAKIGEGVRICASSKIWAPWNLNIKANSSIGEKVDLYSVDTIEIGSNSIISQYSFICTASHDYENSSFPLISEPISIGDSVWIAADSFVGPGVRIGSFVVVGARSSVYKDIEESRVVAGNPAKAIKQRC